MPLPQKASADSIDPLAPRAPEGKDVAQRLFDAIASLDWAAAEKESQFSSEWAALWKDRRRADDFRLSMTWGGLAMAANFDQKDPLEARRAQFSAWWRAMRGNEVIVAAQRDRIDQGLDTLGSEMPALVDLRFLAAQGLPPEKLRRARAEAMKSAVAAHGMQNKERFEAIREGLGKADEEAADREAVFSEWAGHAHAVADPTGDESWEEKKTRAADELRLLLDAGWVKPEDMGEPLGQFARRAIAARERPSSSNWGERNCMAFLAAIRLAGKAIAKDPRAPEWIGLLGEKSKRASEPGASEWGEARAQLLAAVEAFALEAACESVAQGDARRQNPDVGAPGRKKAKRTGRRV